jgi:hypothetical protein
MELSVALAGAGYDDLESLYERVSSTEEFRGQVRWAPPKNPARDAGAKPNAFLVTVEADPTLTVLANTLSGWMQTRRPNAWVRIAVRHQRRRVEITATNAADAAAVLRHALADGG